MDPARLYSFLSWKEFSDKWSSIGLDDGDLMELETLIAADPNRGRVIAGTGGLRKIRFAPTRAGRGKSGAYRACYYFVSPPGMIVLMEVFAKSEKDNLSAAEKNEYRAISAEIARLIRGGDQA